MKIVSVLPGFDFFKDLGISQGPRELKKWMRARSTKYDPKIQIFAFYCIFSLQFSKVSEGPGPHGPHTHEALGSDFFDPL